MLSCGLAYESRKQDKAELVLEDLRSTLLSERNLILFLCMNVIEIIETKLQQKNPKKNRKMPP